MQPLFVQGNITSTIRCRVGSQEFNVLAGVGWGVGAEGIDQRHPGQSQARLLALHILHQFGEPRSLRKVRG